MVEREYAVERQAQRYLELYREVIAARAGTDRTGHGAR